MSLLARDPFSLLVARLSRLLRPAQPAPTVIRLMESLQPVLDVEASSLAEGAALLIAISLIVIVVMVLPLVLLVLLAPRLVLDSLATNSETPRLMLLVVKSMPLN